MFPRVGLLSPAPAPRKNRLTASPRLASYRAMSIASDKIPYVIQNLKAAYGVPEREPPISPLDVLILAILSQSTTNVNSNRTFSNLKSRFRSWDEARGARRSTIEAAIKSGGLGRQKAQRIKLLLTNIHNRTGQTDLNFLCGLPIDEATDFLSNIKGVGPITIACTLLFACGQPVFPVDTHILRIAKRLGLIGDSCGDKEAHLVLAALFPPDRYYEAHINLIRHGRSVCRPRNPSCEQCCLVDYCEFYRSL